METPRPPLDTILAPPTASDPNTVESLAPRACTDSAELQEKKGTWPFIPRWLMVADLTPSELRLLCYLWSWAAKTNETWLTADQIEADLKICRSHRKTVSANLRRKGFLDVVTGYRTKCNRYILKRDPKGPLSPLPIDDKEATVATPYLPERGLSECPKGPLSQPPMEPYNGTSQSGNTPKPPEGAGSSDSLGSDSAYGALMVSPQPLDDWSRKAEQLFRDALGMPGKPLTQDEKAALKGFLELHTEKSAAPGIASIREYRNLRQKLTKAGVEATPSLPRPKSTDRFSRIVNDFDEEAANADERLPRIRAALEKLEKERAKDGPDGWRESHSEIYGAEPDLPWGWQDSETVAAIQERLQAAMKTHTITNTTQPQLA